VQCDANETTHQSISYAYKQTNADGTKDFYTAEDERIEAEHNYNVGSRTCKVTFDNGTVSLVDETSYAIAQEQQRRRK
jgi:hypothetical protein